MHEKYENIQKAELAKQTWDLKMKNPQISQQNIQKCVEN